METLREPRWQDWEYVYHGDVDGDGTPEGGMFGYLGDGWTEAEKSAGDVVWYLDEIDYPTVPARKVGKKGEEKEGGVGP